MGFEDEVDKELSNQATDQLRVSTRQMIRAGIESDDAIKMTRLMLGHHFREEHALRAHAIIMSAQEQGLPVVMFDGVGPSYLIDIFGRTLQKHLL